MKSNTHSHRLQHSKKKKSQNYERLHLNEIPKIVAQCGQIAREISKGKSVQIHKSSITWHGQQQACFDVSVKPCGNPRGLVIPLGAVREINVSYYGLWRASQFRFTRHILDRRSRTQPNTHCFWHSRSVVFMPIHLCYDAVSSAEITSLILCRGRINSQLWRMWQKARTSFWFNLATDNPGPLGDTGFYGIQHFPYICIGLYPDSNTRT
jgi:hypothetical protein